MTLMKEAIDGLLARRAPCVEADSYYDGTVPEVWASALLSRRFGNRTKYRLNLAAVVVDAVNNRLEIDAIIAAKKGAQDTLNRILEQNEMALEANEIHKRALVYGECFVIVWPDEDGEVEISYNAPTNAGIVYSNENQRKKEFAIKMWVTNTPLGQKETRLNLYFDDRIEKYRADGEVTSGNSHQWSQVETVDNPFGKIPVFHFRTSRPRGTPEHLRAYGPQDMINKLVNTHMDTVDYQGAPQRYALTGAMDDTEADVFEEENTDRENLDALRNGPGELWYLKGVHNVGQFQPADHKVFTEPVAVYTRQMASTTDTPMHYFERSASVPSGEALRTAEAPLIKKVGDRQSSFGSTWRDVYRFGLLIEGVDSDVQVKWKPSESMDPLDAWEVATRKKLVGVSPYTIFLEMGYDSEIARTMADEVDARVANTAQPGMNAHNIEKQVTKEEGVTNE